MKHLTILIKPASSLCNMRCRYCFYADVANHREIRSYGIMTPETRAKLIANLFASVEEGGTIDIAFQGGEPTTAGRNWFREFAAEVDKEREKKPMQVNFSIQTNGYLIDGEWCAFLKERNFLVGLSIDGPKRFHDANRVDAAGDGTFMKLRQAVRLFKQYGVEFNVLCVLTKENAAHPDEIWNYFRNQKIGYLQFIPCLPELGEGDNVYSLTPQLFCSFYTRLFELWRDEFVHGNYISVKLFDDLANMCLAHRVTGCGMNGQCNMQYVVEADGSVYPCDFYVLDDYRMGNLAEEPIEDIRGRYERSSFKELRKDLPETCRNCRYVKLCGGGCVRERQSMYIQGDYCGYRELLAKIGDPLLKVTAPYVQP